MDEKVIKMIEALVAAKQASAVVDALYGELDMLTQRVRQAASMREVAEEAALTATCAAGFDASVAQLHKAVSNGLKVERDSLGSRENEARAYSFKLPHVSDR